MDRLEENLLCRALVPGSEDSVGSVGELLRFLISLGKGRSGVGEGADCFWGVDGVVVFCSGSAILFFLLVKVGAASRYFNGSKEEVSIVVWLKEHV